ncbi:MAG: hypothetical protein ACL93V_06200 [Candidatus Electrothrix sp. YB6]
MVAENGKGERVECSFSMNPFDKELVAAGGGLCGSEVLIAAADFYQAENEDKGVYVTF